MTRLSPEGTKLLSEIAAQHGVSTDAVEGLLIALAEGGGTQAQFNHPDLGGMGQWSAGGMTMVGDMFNNALKAKVDALCSDLARHLRDDPAFAPPAMSQSQSSAPSLFVSGPGSGQPHWPADLGTPSSSGRQNDMRYAVFPGTRRLAVEVGGRTDIYDTADHVISGVSQQQSGDRTLTFVSQHGPVALSSLRKVGSHGEDHADTPPAGKPSAHPTASQVEPDHQDPARASAGPAAGKPTPQGDDVLSLIRKLAELKEDGILTDQEFAEKKAELLSRL